MKDLKNIAEVVALSFLGRPYIWAGDDPVQGFDCSGLVIEILKSVGRLPRRGDWTAAGLAGMFTHVPIPDRGCLVFWENSVGRIIHVEYCLDSALSIGASGGGRSTQSSADAIRSNAYVKIRPFISRPNIAFYADPYATNGGRHA
jgi:cell wall-associated NlpC family hydrolase